MRPDVAGWRRERLPALPDEPFMRVVPDWLCEIVSPSSASRDRGRKKRLYHRHQLRHYWILDPIDQTLSVNRWTAEGYVELLHADSDETVRADPFEAIEIDVSAFFARDG